MYCGYALKGVDGAYRTVLSAGIVRTGFLLTAPCFTVILIVFVAALYGEYLFFDHIFYIVCPGLAEDIFLGAGIG